MFRRNSIVLLLLALAVLVGVYFIVDYTGSEDRTFRSKVIDLDPATVTSLIVTDHQTGDHVEILLEEESCRLLSDDREYNGDANAVANAVAMLNQLPTESVVATNSSKWEQYKVDNTQALQIQVFEDSRQIGELFVGKFDFKQIPATQPGRQPQTRMTSYVRVSGDEKVYAVNGLLRSNFQGGETPFRNRTLFFCAEPVNDITRLSISGPGGEVLLELGNQQWLVNGVVADSVKTDKYLRSLSRLRSSTFIDDVNLGGQKPAYTLEIEGTTFSPVTMNAYPADSTVMYYMTSSANPGSIFNGAKGTIFGKAFVGIDAFLPE